MSPAARRSCLVFVFVILTGLTGRAETLRLRADSWMPYNGDAGAALPGYTVELARAIFEPRGITVDYQTMTWGDALKAAAAGQIEAVVGANKGGCRHS